MAATAWCAIALLPAMDQPQTTSRRTRAGAGRSIFSLVALPARPRQPAV